LAFTNNYGHIRRQPAIRAEDRQRRRAAGD
jgi:hypothetical protein